MNVSPCMPLQVADYLAETCHLTAEELGAYHRLGLHYWQRSKPLSAVPNKLARLAGLSLDRWAEVEPTLSEFFEIRDGLWYHPGIEAKLARAATKSEKARQAGQQSWKNRTLRPAKLVQSERLANAKQPLQGPEKPRISSPSLDTGTTGISSSNSDDYTNKRTTTSVGSSGEEPPPSSVNPTELIPPAKLNPAEVVLAIQLVTAFAMLQVDAQTLLDELADGLNRSKVHTPISYLHALCKRFQGGTFHPSGALKVQKARAAAARQAERETRSRQQAETAPTAPPPEPPPRQRRERPQELQQMKAILTGLTGRVPGV